METGNAMINPAFRLVVCAIVVMISGAVPAKTEHRTRSVTGVVTDRRGNALKGAAVQLENPIDLSILSYLTREDGRYYFHQLSPDVDFTLTAKYKRWWSKAKTVDKFSSKETVEITLEIPVE